MHKLITTLIIALARVACAGDELISISASQRDGEITILVKNVSAKTLFIANPEYCGMQAEFSSESAQGGFEAFQHTREEKPWKHLVVLAPNAEDRPDLWTHQFKISAQRNEPLLKLSVQLWMATEEDFKKSTILSLKLASFPVVIRPGR